MSMTLPPDPYIKIRQRVVSFPSATADLKYGLVHDNLVVNIGGHNASLTDSLLTLPSWRDCRSIVQR